MSLRNRIRYKSLRDDMMNSIARRSIVDDFSRNGNVELNMRAEEDVVSISINDSEFVMTYGQASIIHMLLNSMYREKIKGLRITKTESTQ